MAMLVTLFGAGKGRSYRLKGECARLGRHEDCEINEPFASIKTVSRFHAQILQQDGRFLLQDLGSRSGTLLNNERLESNATVPLKEDDSIEICDVSFRFSLLDPEPAAEALAKTSVATASAGKKASLGSVVMIDDKLAEFYSIKLDRSLGNEQNSARKFRALVEVLETFGKSLDIEQMLDSLLSGLFQVFPAADRAVVALVDESGTVSPRVKRSRRPDDPGLMSLSRTIVDRVMQSQEAVLSLDMSRDTRFNEVYSVAAAGIRSLMCVPLIDSQGRSFGILQVDSMNPESAFDSEDLEVIAMVVQQASIMLQYSRLHSESLARQGIDRDLELARDVQRGLLPETLPALETYDCFASYDAAYQVGGDFYDFIPLPGDRLAVVIADVSGKGVSAALVVARMAGELKFHLATYSHLAEAIFQMNNSLCARNALSHFVTLVTMTVNLKTHAIQLVNAGHPAPLVRRADGTLEEISREPPNPPLGVFPDADFSSLEFSLSPGDALVLFTDGFSEAINAADEQYGLPRLKKAVGLTASQAADVGKNIINDVKQFVDGHPQSDDMCLVCLGRPLSSRQQ